MSELKKIRIFIGSSIEELASERMELVRFIQGLNNKYIDHGIYIEPFVCEEMSGEMRTPGTQEYINRYIDENADATFFMFFNKAGRYTVEELVLARKVFVGSNGKKPKVFVFFKTVDNEPVANVEVKSVVDKIANEFAHYYKKFTDPDTVKLEMLQFISDMLGVGHEIGITDGLISIGNIILGKDEINEDNIFAYRNNPDLKRLRDELAELKKSLIKAIEDDDYSAKNEINEGLDRKRKEYTALEKNILSMLKTLHKEMSGTHVDETRIRALSYLEIGEYAKALELMSQESIDFALEEYRDEKDAEGERLKFKAGEIVMDACVRIDALKLGISDPGRFAKIESTYDSVLDILSDADRLDVMYDFASFLCDEKRYDKGINIGEKLKWYYSDPEKEVSDGKKSALFNLLGVFYSDNGRPAEAEKLYIEALEIRRRLAKSNPTAYESCVAGTCNNLAGLYSDTGKPEEAEALCKEALGICRRLAATNPAAYELDVAMTCNNLAVLYSNTGKSEEAEALCKEALEIRRRLAAVHPAAYESDVASTCYNLANLYSDTGRLKEAEAFYLEALGICRRLAATHPAAHEPYVAMVCYSLANLYSSTDRPDEAEKLYKEALEIRRRLAAVHPAAYESDVASTCYNLANLYSDTGRLKVAEAFYLETLEIYSKLAGSNSAAYEPYVALACNNLASLYSNTGRLKVAKRLYIEALEIRRRLAESNPVAYEPTVALTCYSLAIIYIKQKEHNIAQNLFAKALEIAKRYPNVPYCAQIIAVLEG